MIGDPSSLLLECLDPDICQFIRKRPDQYGFNVVNEPYIDLISREIEGYVK